MVGRIGAFALVRTVEAVIRLMAAESTPAPAPGERHQASRGDPAAHDLTPT